MASSGSSRLSVGLESQVLRTFWQRWRYQMDVHGANSARSDSFSVVKLFHIVRKPVAALPESVITKFFVISNTCKISDSSNKHVDSSLANNRKARAAPGVSCTTNKLWHCLFCPTMRQEKALFWISRHILTHKVIFKLDSKHLLAAATLCPYYSTEGLLF